MANIEYVDFTSQERVMGPDGILYELVISGEAELVRGPLGRFLDLAEAIEAEGLTVPPEITNVLKQLNEQKG
jgi:hypothetical protein